MGLWDLGGKDATSTKDVAARLSVSPASASNMFVRLQEMGLVKHERYHGASLTNRGQAEALRLIRRHRLIETFLLEHLGYPWQEVHEEAERLEHAASDAFTERLAELLGHPGRDPHGAPIPAANGTLPPEDSHLLSEAEAGERRARRRLAGREQGRRSARLPGGARARSSSEAWRKAMNEVRYRKGEERRG